MIYQWTVFNTDSNEFEYFISKDKAEADREAWERFCEAVDGAKKNDCLEYASADDIEDFTCNSTQYVDTDGFGSTEFGYIQFKVL